MSDNNEHFKNSDFKGIYYKTESYRQTCAGCGRGYHANRWDAHHILPGVSFSNLKDDFALNCLKITPFDINQTYALGGLPKLTAFILHFQRDKKFPFQAALERTVTMLRWGTVQPYASDAGKAITFPGNLPVHNPTNWGHTEYNSEVQQHMEDEIFDNLKGDAKHPKPKNVEAQLKKAVLTHWGRLVAIANGAGGGGLTGIEANLRHRYDTAKSGWWKPMCMSREIDEAPASPSLT